MRRRRRSRSRSRKNSVYAKSCLINFSLLNTASESKHIIELRCRTPAKAKVIIFMTWKKKSYLNTEAQIVVQILNEYIQEGNFQKNILPRKIKGGDEIIWRPRFLLPSLSSVFEKEKFISAFISKLDAIYCLSKARFSQAVAANAYLPAQCGLRC